MMRFNASPLRFQQFACAVMSVRENCVFQRFGEGRDGGIDGLYVSVKSVSFFRRNEPKLRAGRFYHSARERKKLQPGNALSQSLVLSVRSIEDEL